MSYKSVSPIIVAEGGTGISSATAYAPICAGTTSTGSFQVASSGISNSGYVLTSNGSSALPTWQAAGGGGSVTIAGDSGSVSGSSLTLTGSTSGAVFSGSGTTLTQSFNFLSLPTSTSTNGQILINSVPVLHVQGTNNLWMGGAGNFTGTRNQCTGIGYQALKSVTTAVGVTAVGIQAMSNATVSGTTSFCTAVGYQALYNTTSATNSTGVGTQALFSQTSTGSNTAVGYQALYNATSGGSNTALGSSAGYAISTGGSNTAIGANSMQGSVGLTGSSNVGVGYNTLNAATSAGNNSALGSGALSAITTGSYNVAIGYNAGSSLATSDSSNININYVGDAGVSNRLVIGSGTGTGNQQLSTAFISGIYGVTTTSATVSAVLVSNGNQLGTITSSARYKENIEDMGDVSSPVMQLRPVTFDYIDRPSWGKQTGLIAEEVAKIMPSLVNFNEDGSCESVKYHDLPVLLLNEMQKISKRISIIEEQLS